MVKPFGMDYMLIFRYKMLFSVFFTFFFAIQTNFNYILIIRFCEEIILIFVIHLHCFECDFYVVLVEKRFFTVGIFGMLSVVAVVLCIIISKKRKKKIERRKFFAIMG